MTSGLLPQGFIAPTQQEILADLVANILSVQPNLDMSPDQPIGQLLAAVAEKIAEPWEAVATIYNSMNPDAAEAQLLVNLSAITGTRPQAATYSIVAATLNLNAGVTVPQGSVVMVSGQPNNRWTLQAAVTNSGGSPANITGSFQSAVPGPFAANAGTLTVIGTPIVGWNSVTNAADAVAGLSADTDATLRVRRAGELAATGSGTVDAIRADLLQVTGIIQAFVFENTSLMTDVNGVPGKAVHAIIWDGVSPISNNLIAQAIWNNKPSGIQSYGNVLGVAIDSQGNNQNVYFDRAVQVPIYFTLTTTPGSLTLAQTNAVKAAIAAFGATDLNLGVSVVALAFRAAALTAGITDVPTFFLGIAPSPVGTTNIVISQLQIATVSTTNILVNGV
jgi:uncharacterized phage protein gp47/JayE